MPGVLGKLESENLICKQGNSYKIRRLGALLLANDLNDFPDVSRKAARVVIYTGTSKLETRLDQIGSKGYATGFQGLINFIMSQLPQNEVIQAALRKEVKLVPEDAIRELVANALIHQDFMIGGSSAMIEIYENRVEISNPGEPIVPIDRFIDGYQSRNERMADLMRRMGICEEKGSGVDRVVHAAEIFQLPPPYFHTTHMRTVVTIYGSKSFRRMDKSERVRACYQHCALRYIMQDLMTNQSLRQRFNLEANKASSVSQVINATIREGLIKADEGIGGSRKYARYVPIWA